MQTNNRAWPGSYEDILQGIEHTGQLSQYKVNSEEIIIMGHSAGGHLALLSGNALHKRKDSKIVAVIGLAAISVKGAGYFDMVHTDTKAWHVSNLKSVCGQKVTAYSLSTKGNPATTKVTLSLTFASA
jgi:predicted alpha/beta hydrolase